jgi:hypothetical protein
MRKGTALLRLGLTGTTGGVVPVVRTPHGKRSSTDDSGRVPTPRGRFIHGNPRSTTCFRWALHFRSPSRHQNHNMVPRCPACRRTVHSHLPDPRRCQGKFVPRGISRWFIPSPLCRVIRRSCRMMRPPKTPDIRILRSNSFIFAPLSPAPASRLPLPANAQNPG